MQVFEYIFTKGQSGLLINFIGSILIRWCVSIGSYSGENKPPLYGDYEAQRHWQEITINLPIQQWYTNSSLNDLQYWGLDYPPLTAYHSWLCGYIASLVNPDWVKLESSRGIESYDHKLFMRYTVLAADLLVLFPALLLLFHQNRKWKHGTGHNAPPLILLMLFYPGLILIDHGHFQYNNVSLGLMLWSFLLFDRESYILGSVGFCMALNYKQMELYHALPVFFFLVGKALSRTWFRCISMIIQLGVTVICCFAVLWLPYLTSLDSTLQVFHRLFPVNRGLYEDKVANFWCAIAPVIKFKEILDQQSILRMCAGSTLFLSLPSCLHLMKNPSSKTLRFSLVNVSMIFFLFSYQVHEKSILIPAISACLLYDVAPPFLISWFLHFTVLSISPLLHKDGLSMQQVATSVIFLILSSLHHGYGKQAVLTLVRIFVSPKQKSKENLACSIVGLFWISIVVSAVLVSLPFVYEPPPRFPDLISVATSAISCAAFLFFTLVFHYLQFTSRPANVAAKKIN